MGKKKNKGGGCGAGGGNVGSGDQNKGANEGGGDHQNKEEDKKKEEGSSSSITVVLKVDMHCDGCGEKVKKSVRGIEGVEKVSVDIESNKLTVVGKVDPMRVRDRVQSKTHKNVELISPAPKKNKDEQNKKDNENQKNKEPPVSTVVLKIRLHCDGCIQRLRKTILRVKGVASVSMEPQKDLVTVRGVMDVKTLPVILKEKLKRDVNVVVPKKDSEGGEKKENCCDDNKEAEMMAAEAKRLECIYAQYGNCGYGYYIETVHAPQLFSDENPNSCSII